MLAIKTFLPVRCLLYRLTLIIKIWGVMALLLLSFSSHAQIIEDIVIKGAERTDGLSLLSQLPIAIGDEFSEQTMDDALKALYATGNFENISLKRDGNDLVITIKEQPIINQIAFEGNNVITDDILQAEIRIRPRQTYNQARVQADVRHLLNIYQRYGRFAIRIEPKIIRLPQNRVNLIFEIAEGRKTKIEHIVFIGNDFYSDGVLKREIYSKERRFLRFFATNFDPERIEGDRQVIRRFYRNRGFPDIDVSSAIAELNRPQKFFAINFAIDEGNRFRISNIKINSKLPNLINDDEGLLKLIRKADLDVNDWYHSDNIDDLQTQIVNYLHANGYPFTDANIQEERNLETRTIDIIYEIDRAPKRYIERIEIVGNTRTLDKVIRQYLPVSEGDPVIPSRVNSINRTLQFTGFFSDVSVDLLDGSEQDKVVLRITVSEKLTGSLNLGIGYGSLNGASLRFGLRESNFGGRGNSIDLSLNISEQSNVFSISNRRPNYRGLPVNVNYSIYRSESDSGFYDRTAVGASAGLSYRIGQTKWYHSISYSQDSTTIDNISTTASSIQQQAGNSITSSISQAFSRDTRNSNLAPTMGTLFSVSQQYSGLGGDNHYVQSTLRYSAYSSLTRNSTIDFRFRAGHIEATKDELRLTDAFYVGGTYLRGFVYGRVGPYDETEGIHLPVTQYATATVETFFPIGFPPESNVKGTLFIDSGIATKTNFAYENSENITDTGSLRQAWGYGLVWHSPVGPIRFEWMRPFNYEETDYLDTYEFSLGIAF
ncbi:MAG: outer membrane protein assembly factor BamA [Alphaproteobacteria bacterium]|nr:outer membrane protein assembly factor BamA [Alphaproteobacteria bacterium]